MGFFDDIRNSLNNYENEPVSQDDTLNAIYKRAKKMFPELSDADRLRIMQFGNFMSASHLQAILIYGALVAPIDGEAVMGTLQVVHGWEEAVDKRLKELLGEDFQEDDEE